MLNVTRAAYSTGNKVRTAPLYQWDYGQILQFEGLDLPANFEAHFSNTPMTGTAITVMGNDNRADIPDSLLQSGGDIWCWVYLHDEVTDGETEYVAVIPVTARPKRDGTEPTPEEQDAIAAAIEALNDATEVLDDAIAHTETYRDQAEAYAVQSESWAIGGTGTRQGEDTDNSKYYRDQAVIAQESAQESAQSASGSATQAGESATQAERSATQAEQSATAADASATQAGQYAQAAQTAQGKAETAQEKAETAEDNAELAQAAAETAQAAAAQSATAAAQSAAAAQAAAMDVIDKAPVIIDTASGAIASFPDGSAAPIKQLTVAVNPVQDLHDYENPWPAGGGKNLLPTSVAGIKSANASGTWSGNEYTYNGVIYTINTDQDGNVTGINANGTASANSDIYLISQYTLPAGSYTLNGCPSGGSASTYRIFATNWGSDTGSGATATLDGSTSSSIRVDIKSGTTVNNLLFKPMIRLSSVADATFAPYSNICPITGWTGAEVVRTGKNMLKFSENIYSGESNATHTFTDDGVVATSTGTYGQVSFEFMDLVIGCQYTLSFIGSSDGNYKRLYVLNADTGYSYGIGKILTETPTAYTITFTATSKRLLFVLYINTSGNTGSMTLSKVQLELGSTATAYEPYTGQTYPITLPSEAGTVYGGTLTVNQDGTGTLVVDSGILDLSTRSASNSGYDWRYSLGTVNGMKNTSATGKGTMCTHYQASAKSWGTYYGPCIMINARGIILADDRFINAPRGLESWLDEEKAAGRTPYFVYPLATPITYTLTAEEMTTLLGQNNWWSNTGDVSVTYRADTRKFIEKKLAALVAALS